MGQVVGPLDQKLRSTWGLRGLLKPKQHGGTKHHRALSHRRVGDALVKVRGSGYWPTVRLAFEFLVLTAARSAEVRGAVWSEIDLEAATWVIPAQRMKAAREHRVPLSGWAVEVLSEARRYSDGSSWVFPAESGGEIPSWVLTKLPVRLNQDVGCLVDPVPAPLA